MTRVVVGLAGTSVLTGKTSKEETKTSQQQSLLAAISVRLCPCCLHLPCGSPKLPALTCCKKTPRFSLQQELSCCLNLKSKLH